MPVPPNLPPISDAPISIILTANNDEATVDQSLRGWIGVLTSIKREFEIILVDDASTDRTVELATAVASHHNQVRILPNATPLGIGAIIRVGIAEARHPLL